jgi:SAM-dependent methyltransferase
MSAGRRKIGVHDAAAWIFNRIADVYAARPPYPTALIDALAEIAGPGRIGDVGAGIGHLAVPLAQRGFDVLAIDPAQSMLDRLWDRSLDRGLALRTLRAAAESLPIEPACLDLVVVADALHFLDAELAANEISRVLAPRGALALVTSELGATPFMRGVARIIESATPRRPRGVAASITQLFAVVGAPLGAPQRFHDETPVDRATLERILRSISFVGPAMNAARFAAFIERIHALPEPRVWARTFTLYAGRRRA